MLVWMYDGPLVENLFVNNVIESDNDKLRGEAC